MQSPPPEPVPQDEVTQSIKRDRRFFLASLCMALLLSGLSVGLLALALRDEELAPPQASSTPSSYPPVSVVTEREAQEERVWNISILNASGVTGAAGKAALTLSAKLPTPRFTLNVTTDNAPRQQGTMITFKSQGIKGSEVGRAVEAVWEGAAVEVDEKQGVDIKVVIGSH